MNLIINAKSEKYIFYIWMNKKAMEEMELIRKEKGQGRKLKEKRVYVW